MQYSPIERIRSDELGLSKDVVELAAPAIDAFLSARAIAKEALDGLGPFDGKNGVIFHTLQNLLGRIEEQTEGMLVCFVSGCPAAAETIARTVVETSVNFMYITRGDCGMRIFSFFRIYLHEHGKKLDDWSAFVAQKTSGDEARIITHMINERRGLVTSLRRFVDQIANGCGFPDAPTSSDWNPKLFERFKATDHTSSYWTIYHRLSAATHGNAEETISWLYGMYRLLDSGDDQLLNKIGVEAVNYTAMMLQFAVKFYIESIVHMCMVHNLIDAANKLKPIYLRLNTSIENISGAAGAPNHS